MKRNIGIALSLFIILILIVVIIISLLIKPTYIVTFNYNYNQMIEKSEVKAGDNVKKPTDPEREGYTFIGWYFNDEEYSFDAKITQDITLIAKWQEIEVLKYTLTFDSLGGTEVNDILIEENTILSDIPNPTKEGYTFKGWYYHNKRYDFTEPITQDMTFVAKWSKN